LKTSFSRNPHITPSWKSLQKITIAPTAASAKTRSLINAAILASHALVPHQESRAAKAHDRHS
jgi:hypothetical protein